MTWLVILVWVAAMVFSLFWLARVGLLLVKKLGDFAKALEPLAKQFEALAKATGKKPNYEAKPDNLQDSPVEHLKTVRAQQKKREARAAERQRRLVDRLKP